MSAKRKGANKSANYVISLSKSDFSQKSKNCLGKLRSNFIGTKFRLFDNGINPKKKQVTQETVRRELLNIYYVS